MENCDYAEWGLYIGVLVGLVILHATGQGIIVAICATSGILIGAIVDHLNRVDASTAGF